MAAVDVIDQLPLPANGVNGNSGGVGYFEKPLTETSVGEVAVSLKEVDPPKVTNGPVQAEQTPVGVGDTEPNGRPANVLHASYPKSDLELVDHHIDDVRSLRVVVIGAGLSGILAGILLPVKVPKIQLTILEKNDDVVGQIPATKTLYFQISTPS